MATLVVYTLIVLAILKASQKLNSGWEILIMPILIITTVLFMTTIIKVIDICQ